MFIRFILSLLQLKISFNDFPLSTLYLFLDLSTCYSDGKPKNVGNCNRFTLSGNICDAPIEFDVNNNFALNEQNENYSKCLSDNKPEYRIKS